MFHQDAERWSLSTQQTTFSPLLSLPNELIEAIAKEIQEDDYGDPFAFQDAFVKSRKPLMVFRRTCRTVESATRNLFVKRYFEFQTLVLDTKRLGRLEDLAKISHIAMAVQDLSVYASTFPGRNPPHRSQAVDPRYTTHSQAASLLAKTLIEFPNLKRLFLKSRFYESARSCFRGGMSIDYHVEIFNVMVAVAEMCGHHLEYIGPFDNCAGRDDFDTTKALSIFRNNQSLATLTRMNIEFRIRGESNQHDEGTLGVDLAIGLNYLQALRSLQLDFSYGKSPSHVLLQKLAESLLLPQLSELSLHSANSLLSSLQLLLYQHRTTLRQVRWNYGQIYGDLSKDALRLFLTSLRDDMRLDGFYATYTWNLYQGVRSSEACLSWTPNGLEEYEDEDEAEEMEFLNRGEVQRGISAMLRHLKP